MTHNSLAPVLNLFNNAKLIEAIQTFIYQMDNEATRKSYTKEINRFFNYLSENNKGIELDENGNIISSIMEEELIVKQLTISQYQIFLRHHVINGKGEKGMNTASVKKAISVLRNLYTFLAANDFNVKSEWFEGLADLPDESMEYEAFTFEQAKEAMEIVRTTEKGAVKAALINTAIHTGFRIHELMKIRERDITLFEGKTWTIHIPKKNAKRDKENLKPITQALYDELQLCRSNDNDPDGYFLKLADNTVLDMMKLIRSHFGLEAPEGEKNKYVFHSFKKCAIVEVYNLTGGDVQAMKEMGNHEDARTTLNIYNKLEKKKRIHNSPSLRIGERIDVTERLQELDKRQILKLLQKCSQQVHFEIDNLLK